MHKWMGKLFNRGEKDADGHLVKGPEQHRVTELGMPTNFCGIPSSCILNFASAKRHENGSSLL